MVTGNPLVFVILGAGFVAVLAWLVFWSRSQSRIVRRFAESKGFVYHERDIDGLEARVNDCVVLEEPNLVRSFSRLGDVVTLIHGAMFRAVELLDLNPYGRAEYVNRSRVAVWFPCRQKIEGIFTVSPALEIYQRYPEEPARIDALRAFLEAARVEAPPCMLSLTLMRGQGVAYLEPAVTGMVSERHLSYLSELAGTLSVGRL